MLTQEEYNILRVIRSKNVGPHTFFKLLNYFNSLDFIIDNIEDFNKRYKLKVPILISTKEEIDREIVGCSTIGAKIITYKNPSYPKLLKEIESFPPVLTILGNQELLSKKSISIVGSRSASSNGCNFARKLAKELGEAGFTITSGFASGIDTAAHKGSLSTGTIAVLGGGIDDIYPRGNEELYYEIKNKGLLISEVAFNSAPKAENFPARNRIVSGLSQAVIIIEAGARSGTIHTARQALEQGRELLVAPGNPYDYRCEGSNRLIKDGANVITSTEDVLDILENFTINTIAKNKLKLEDQLSAKSTIANNKIIDNFIINNELMENIISERNLTTKELILSKLNYTPLSIDLLCEELNLSTSVLNIELSELELEDKITILNGTVKLK